MDLKNTSKHNVLFYIYWALLLIIADTALTTDVNLTENNENYKILLIAAVGTRSHKNFFMGTVRALAERNHQVTVLSTFKESENIPNVKDIVLDGSDLDVILRDPFESGQLSIFWELATRPAVYCTERLAAKEIHELKQETFDLVIISPWAMNDCFFSLIHHFNVPYVFIFPNILTGPISSMAGGMHFESLSPLMLLDTSQPPTFFDRMKSIVMHAMIGISFNKITLPRMRRMCIEAGMCSDDVPPFQDFYGKNSLVIINSVKALENPPQPTMPQIIHAGGIHCRPAKQLSKDLEDWMQDSEEGFIFFSLGSAVNPSNMPEEYRDIFLKVFGSLKYKVLWKWDQEIIDGLPSNVKLSKWLPQQDILGQEKIRIFITHGGLLSLQEATYHNVPVLGMPLFTDQFYNIRQVLRDGWGAKLDWTDLSEDLLKSKILTVIQSDEIRNATKRWSEIMRDRLIQPSEEVAYWIEYVIRHDGAEHIISSFQKLYVWQLYNIDVWLVILFVSTIISAMFIFTCKKICIKIIYRKYKAD